MQKLNLNSPAPQPSVPDTSLSDCLSAIAKANPARLNLVQRRTEQILQAGQAPEWIFLCGGSRAHLTFHPGAGHKPLILLFTTLFAARDYIRATNASAEARQVKFDSLPELAQGWIAAGPDHFVLNRCPRCQIMNTIPMEALKDKGQFLKIWAVLRATQMVMGELKVREYLQYHGSDRPRARAALEAIRDHIDCGVPYLFELLAFLARMDQDEAAKTAAIARLEEFGPQFTNWESRWGMANLPGALASATVMLGKSFGMELKPRT